MLPLAAVGILAALDLIQIGENLAALLFLLFYAVTGLAVALGVLVAMRQRLRELDRGEEDDAKSTDPRARRRAGAIRGAVTGIAVRLLAAAVLVWIRPGHAGRCALRPVSGADSGGTGEHCSHNCCFKATAQRN